MDIVDCILAIMYIVALGGVLYYINKLQIDKLKRNSKPINKVHFYVARDKDGILALWLGKPHRGKYYWLTKGNKMLMAADIELNLYGLNIDDYKDLKWKDEPVEVFLNLED